MRCTVCTHLLSSAAARWGQLCRGSGATLTTSQSSPWIQGKLCVAPADVDLFNVFLARARLTGHCSGSLWNLFWTEQS